MSANFSRLDILLGGDASGAVAAFDTADQAFQRFQVRMAKENLGGGGGGGGMFKQLVAGAGATAGAYAFQKVAESAKNAATAIRTGASESQTFGSIIDGIPIVGQFKKAGEAIRELIVGEKAALIQAEKLGEAAEKISAAYARRALQKQTFGLRGDDKSAADAELSHGEKLIELGKKVEDANKARASFETDHAASSLLHPIDRIKQSFKGNEGRTSKDYSDSEKANYAILLKDEADANVAKRTQTASFAASEVLRKEDIAQRQLETFRAMDEQRIATETSDKIKALRKQGLTIESALLAVEAHGEADYRSRHNRLDNTKLDALLGGRNGAEAKALKAQVAAEDLAAKATEDNERADLLEEGNRKQQEIYRGNEEAITHIKAEAAIERQKLAHDELGAELATIQESYRVAIVEAEKKQRETRRLQNTDKADPQLIAERQALALKAGLGSDLAKDKDKTVQAEKQIGIEEKLSKLRMDSLKGQAENGDYKARRELEILEIQEKTHEKLLQIKQLENDRNVTIEQRKRLQELAVSTTAQGILDVGRVGIGHGILMGATAKAETGSHLSGLAQASREATEPKQIAKNTMESAKTAALMLEGINTLIGLTKTGGNFTLPTF